MNGEELKQYIKRSGMSVAAVAEKLGTSPQNLNAKFNRKSIKIDFFQKIKEIIEKYKGEKTLLRFSEHFKTVDSATVMINKKLANVRQGLTTYYARHTWASIAFNIGIQKDVVSLALGHSFGVRVTDTYINADLSRVDEANRRVIDYVLYNKK